MAGSRYVVDGGAMRDGGTVKDWIKWNLEVMIVGVMETDITILGSAGRPGGCECKLGCATGTPSWGFPRLFRHHERYDLVQKLDNESKMMIPFGDCLAEKAATEAEIWACSLQWFGVCFSDHSLGSNFVRSISQEPYRARMHRKPGDSNPNHWKTCWLCTFQHCYLLG
jgi:hypothetical protein